MKKNFAVSAMLCVCLSPASALAGMYIGADIGFGHWDVDFSDDFNIDGSLSGGSFKRGDVAGGIRLGYQITDRVATEVSYQSLGKTTYDGRSVGGAFFCPGKVNAEVKATAVDATLVGNLPITTSLNLLGRVGVARWSSEAKLDDSCGRFSGSDTGTDLTFGLGVQWDASDRYSFRLEGQQYNDVGDEFTIRTVSLGLLARF